MKKKTVIIIAVLVLLVLFLPISYVTYRDGGTRDFRALTYRLVIWNRFIADIADDPDGDIGIYRKTCIYWFPDSLKSIDELWEIEQERNR